MTCPFHSLPIGEVLVFSLSVFFVVSAQRIELIVCVLVGVHVVIGLVPGIEQLAFHFEVRA